MDGSALAGRPAAPVRGPEPRPADPGRRLGAGVGPTRAARRGGRHRVARRRRGRLLPPPAGGRLARALRARSARRAPRAPMSAHGETEQRVTPLELFFDLVFVFAITRVTSLMAHDLSWASIGQGLLVLAALWWGWAAYAWLTNHVAGDSGSARVVVFIAMGAMVLVALAVPDAFGDHALLFALAYLVMRLAHLGLYWVASSEDAEVHVAVLRLLPSGIGGPLVLVAAAFTDGTLQAAL